MQRTVIDKIEYLILLVSEFASHNNVSEVQAYRYLCQHGALALCEKALQHHAHTLGGGQYADSPILLPSERRYTIIRLYHGSIVSIDSTLSVHGVQLTNS